MTDYAISLKFDSESEEKCNALINEIAAVTGNNYIPENTIMPHISVAMFTAENDDVIKERIQSSVESGEFFKFDLPLSSIGAFNPAVVFLAPIMNAHLLNACRHANEISADYPVGDNGNYLPYCWVPHLALAVKLNSEQLNKAFEITAKKFKPFTAKVNRVALWECNPAREIAFWDL